jgi:tol-pal system protein YbgF
VRAVAALGLAGLLVGCAELPWRRSAPAVDLAELERRVVAAEQRAARAEVEVERLRREIEGRAAGVRPSDERGGTSAPARPDQEAVGELVEAEAPLPRERRSIEESDLEPDASSTPGERWTLAPDDLAASQALYDRSYAALSEGRRNDAEAGFTRYLETFPSSDLSDNATFWLGECRRQAGDLVTALARFREVVERYPSGNKVPDALWKVGQVLAAQGRTGEARAIWLELGRRFPATAAAENAARQLAETAGLDQ